MRNEIEALRRPDPQASTSADQDVGSARVRLCTFVTNFGIGGTEKQMLALARGLDCRRVETHFGCLHRWGPLLGEVESEYGPVPEYRIRNLRSLHTVRAQWRLASDLRRRRIQVLHSYNFYANSFSLPAAKLARIPCVIASIRDMGVYLSPAQLRVQKWLCRLADHILVNAEAIKGWLTAQGYRAERISVIPNGVDLARFERIRVVKNYRERLGLPAEASLVLLLARLNPKKGIEDFLRAAARVSHEFPHAYFLVVGGSYTATQNTYVPDQGYSARLLKFATELGIAERVRLTGFIENIPELLSQISVSVLPSLSEGLSNTLLESMAAGVPVISTRVGGAAEAISEGEQGLLVPPHDDAALANALRSLLRNPELARRMGERARIRIQQHYSLEGMVRETQALYLRLLARKQPAYVRALEQDLRAR